MSTWLLLRGLARERRHWGRFPSLLQSALPPGERVIALDLPGNGERWREPSPPKVAGMVEALRAQLRAAGQGPPYVLVALSLGGMVALEWAAQHPQEVAGAILINTSVAGFSPWWQRLRPSALPALLACLLSPSLRLREQAVFAATSTGGADPAVIEAWIGIARTCPVSRFNVARQLVAAARFRLPERLEVPGLVLASAADRLVSPECSRAIARSWGLPLREHPRAGHDLTLDAPAWAAGQIAAWHAHRFGH